MFDDIEYYVFSGESGDPDDSPDNIELYQNPNSDSNSPTGVDTHPSSLSVNK